jgi:hypothetical protein
MLFDFQLPLVHIADLFYAARGNTRDLTIVVCAHKSPRQTLAHAVLVFLTFLAGTPLFPRRTDLKSLSGIVFGSPLIVGMNRRECLWRKKTVQVSEDKFAVGGSLLPHSESRIPSRT